MTGIGVDPPPLSSDPAMRAPHSAARRDPVRTAGLLLMIASALELITFAVQARWDWFPNRLAVAEVSLQAVLGIGLFRWGRWWALPTLVFLFTATVFSLFTSVLSHDLPAEYVFVLLLAPGVMGLLRILPPLLLLTGTPSRHRSIAAVSLFVLQQIVGLASVALTIYVTQWMAGR